VGVTGPAPGGPIEALTAAVGAPHVLAGEAARAFAVDGSVPRAAVFPGSVEEVARVLAVARAHGLGVVPTGLGARLGWGMPPRRLDLVVSLRRMDRLLHHEPADLTLSVQAGIDLETLNARLAPHRQFVPLDPPRPARSTVGGLVATAVAGPYRARYGTMRDLLLGLTVVSGDGAVVRGGGRVVKNVTGYDMSKLHVGAMGTLGVVVEAHLRVHPRPAEEATWVLAFGSPEAALEAALSLRDTPVIVSRLELLAGGALGASGVAGEGGAALAVTVGSVPEAVRAQGTQVLECGRRAGGRPLPVGEPAAWWRRVADATWLEGADAVGLRIGVRPTDVVKAWRAVEGVGLADAQAGTVAEVANGVLHVAARGVPAGAMAGLVRHLRGDLAGLGASCVVEQAPPAAKAGLDVWGDVGPALGVMRRVKDALDPGGVLNPGRYLGGI
jgi:glycolate oxidase FAD binding subunit